MITTSITVERNFHIMNDDRFIMEKISQTIELEEGEDSNHAMTIARRDIELSFRRAYPHLEEHLNFHIVRQTNSDYKPIEYMLPELKQYQSTIPAEKTNNPTIEDKPVYKYPTATAETVKKEMENYKLSSKIFTAVYGEQVKGNAELEKIYADKLTQLQTIEKKPKQK